MKAHRKQISAIKLTMNMAKHGAKGLNIFRSHRKNSYTTVSVSFFGLPAVQSSRDTRNNSIVPVIHSVFGTLAQNFPASL